MRDVASLDYLTSEDVVLEELNLGVIDCNTKIEAFKVLHTDENMTDEEYVRKVADALGFTEEQYNNFARVNINLEIKINGADLGTSKTSVVSRLDLSMLDSMIVKDLPEKVRGKLLSIIRLQRQRKRRQKQALANKKKTTKHGADTVDGDTEQEAYDEDTGNSNLHSNRRNSTVNTNRKRRDSQGKEGKLHGNRGSMEDVSDHQTGKFQCGLLITIICTIFETVISTQRNNSSPIQERSSSTNFLI